MDPLLRLRHLKCFLETARLGSLSAAAQALHVSQPAASKTIRELEDILQAKLFERVGRGLVLSPAGRVFQTHAGAAMRDLARAQDLVRAAPKERMRVVVGVLPTAAAGLVPRAALEFRARHSDVLLEVMTGPNWLLLSLLREGQLDLVVGRMPPSGKTEGLSFKPLYWEKVVPVVRAGHPLLSGRWMPEDLARYPLMLPPVGALISGSVKAWLHSVGLEGVEPAFENVSPAFGREVLRGSDTIWFISEGVVAPEVARGELAILPIKNELLGGPVGYSQRMDRDMSPEARALLSELERAAQQMGE